MRPQILLVLFFTGIECLEISGYLGKSVTLPSGGNSSWNPTTIKWSIFPNNTWIATYLSGNKITERVDHYKGRLSLNISSEPLKKPTIKRLFTSCVEGGCLMKFNCISVDQHVSLTWLYDRSLIGSYLYFNDNTEQMLVLLNRTQTDVKFTCISNKNKQNVSSDITWIQHDFSL
ncbi:hypothetical protein PAMP_015864 [Pampus punctatissimus]